MGKKRRAGELPGTSKEDSDDDDRRAPAPLPPSCPSPLVDPACGNPIIIKGG